MLRQACHKRSWKKKYPEKISQSVQGPPLVEYNDDVNGSHHHFLCSIQIILLGTSLLKLVVSLNFNLSRNTGCSPQIMIPGAQNVAATGKLETYATVTLQQQILTYRTPTGKCRKQKCCYEQRRNKVRRHFAWNLKRDKLLTQTLTCILLFWCTASLSVVFAASSPPVLCFVSLWTSAQQELMALWLSHKTNKYVNFSSRAQTSAERLRLNFVAFQTCKGIGQNYSYAITFPATFSKENNQKLFMNLHVLWNSALWQRRECYTRTLPEITGFSF